MFRWEHILIKRLFTSLALLFNLLLLGVSSSKTEILFLSDFGESAGSMISPPMLLDILSEFESLAPQCNINIKWSRSKSRTAGFAWSCMHLILAELNGRTWTRHLWFSFHVTKKPFNFFTILSPSMKTVSFEVGDDGELLTLLSLLLLLLLLFSLLLLLLLLFYCYYYYCHYHYYYCYYYYYYYYFYYYYYYYYYYYFYFYYRCQYRWEYY